MNKLFLSLALLVVAPMFVSAEATTDTGKVESAVKFSNAVENAVLNVVTTTEVVKAEAVKAEEVVKAVEIVKAVEAVKAEAVKAEEVKAEAVKAVEIVKAEDATVADASYADRVLTAAKNKVAALRGLVERNPLVAMATIAAATMVIIEAVHYFTALEVDEDAQF